MQLPPRSSPPNPTPPGSSVMEAVVDRDGESEGAAARGREGAEGRLSACSQEQREGGRAALHLCEP
jgi:hypothetical protein